MQDIYKLIKKYHKDEFRKSKISSNSSDYFLASFKLTKPQCKRKTKKTLITPKKQYRNENCRITETSI